MPQSPSVGYSRAPEACHKGVYGSRVGRRGYRLLKRELKTVYVAIPITLFKDDKTGKYSVEYGEIYPETLEIEGVMVKFVNDLESETARE